jgi:hypothetical protein
MDKRILAVVVMGVLLAGVVGEAYAQALNGDSLTLNPGGGNGGTVILEADGYPTRYIDNRFGHMRFYSAGRLDMIVRGTGRVGINTSAPVTELHVNGDTTSGSFIVDNGASNGGFFEFRSAGNPSHFMTNVGGTLRITNQTGPEFTIDANGNASFVNEVKLAVLEIRGEGNDLAEGFKVNGDKETVRPGMVVVIDPDHPGEMKLSSEAYQRTAAGIISGAGNTRVGIQLGNSDEVKRGELQPVALTGRVWCMVDATQRPVVPGDLLTTSDTLGHAMRVEDYARAQGAIIGKAMTPLAGGKDLVLVLVSLQ